MQYITDKQRKKAFAMLDEMKDHVGYLSLPHYYEAHKLHFTEVMDYPKGKMFSLATDKCSVREYNVFIDYLTEEWFSLGVQSDHSPLIYIDDVERYVGICMKLRICCISGYPDADIHHALDDKVGMGNNRKKLSFLGLKAIPLSRKYHQLLHTMDEQEFYKLYHVTPIRVTKELLKYIE